MKLCVIYLLIISAENVIIESSSSSLTLESLTQHVLQLEQTVSDLQSQSKTQEQKSASVLQSVLSKLAKTTDELNALREAQNSTQSVTKTVTAANNSSPTVSFEVKQWSTNLENLKDNEIFKFDTVDMNIGGGYDNTTGIFIAPVPGIYLFWCQVMINGSTRLRLELIKNGTSKAYGYVPSGAKFGMADLTTVLRLNQFDTIWFSKKLSSGIHGSGYSSYGGALLQWIP